MFLQQAESRVGNEVSPFELELTWNDRRYKKKEAGEEKQMKSLEIVSEFGSRQLVGPCVES